MQSIAASSKSRRRGLCHFYFQFSKCTIFLLQVLLNQIIKVSAFAFGMRADGFTDGETKATNISKTLWQPHKWSRDHINRSRKHWKSQPSCEQHLFIFSLGNEKKSSESKWFINKRIQKRPWHLPALTWHPGQCEALPLFLLNRLPQLCFYFLEVP